MPAFRWRWSAARPSTRPSETIPACWVLRPFLSSSPCISSFEAGVWRSVAHPFEGDHIFRYLYTGIAFLVWPVLTPFAAAYAETDAFRQRLWTCMLYVGEALAAYLFIKLALADSIALTVNKHSLAYDPGFERPPLLAHCLYVVLTVVLLVSFNSRALRLFGALVFLTFVYALANNRPVSFSPSR